MSSEQTIQQEIRIACSNGQTRLFRNNTGTLRDQHGRPVQFGLCKGHAWLSNATCVMVMATLSRWTGRLA